MVEKRNNWELFHKLSGLTREERRSAVGLERFSRDIVWIDNNFPTLREKYPDQFIAVRRFRVVDADPDARILVGRLKEKYPRHWSTITTQFISAQNLHIVPSNF